MQNPNSIQFTGRIHVKLKRAWASAADPANQWRQFQVIARSVGLEPLQSPIERARSIAGLSEGPDTGSLSLWYSAKASSADEEAVWSAIRSLLAQPEVDYAEPDAVYDETALRTLPGAVGDLYREQLQTESVAPGLATDFTWHLDQIGAKNAWATYRGRFPNRHPGDGILIAHIDTGYSDHRAVPILNFLDAGRDFYQPERGDAQDPGDGSFHGTGTLCILAGDSEDEGYKGVAYGAKILPLRVGKNPVLFASEALAHAIWYAKARGTQVITLSMGGLPSQLWADAVNDAYEAGIVMCAAAGNHFAGELHPRALGPRHVVFPARFDRVLAVSGMTKDEDRYWFAKGMSGNEGKEVDICAPTPGVAWARWPGGGYKVGEGTSCATPQVAGAAAIWLSYWAQQLSNFSPIERVEACRHALLTTALDRGKYPYQPVAGAAGRTRNDHFGDGRLNVDAALGCAPVPRLPASPRADVSVGDLIAPWQEAANESVAGDPTTRAKQIELRWALAKPEVRAEMSNNLLDALPAHLR
jgi:subtilisin family serine protease